MRLVNVAFRVERFFIDRDRINLETVQGLFETGNFLLAYTATDIVGCVYVELRGERGYFGLLAVKPTVQRGGLGRRLTLEAEEYVRARGCAVMDIRVVNLRAESPQIYRKMGYVETGTEPFKALAEPKVPCHFVIMSKPLV